MARLDLRSREYKVMLLPERFAGDDADVRGAAAAFWADVDDLVDGLDIQTRGAFDAVKAHRRIRFLDTEERHFHAHRYVFRERISVELGEREVTLKFRHPDRYLAADRDMDAGGDHKAETKFEEDVKPPFTSVFSYSTSVGLAPEAEISKVRDVMALFPGLAREVVHDILLAMAEQLPLWVHPTPTTKTAFVYG